MHPTELGSADIQIWHEMQQKTDTLMNPFLCPEFALGIGQSRQNARAAVLTEGQETFGFFPFERKRFGVGMPIGYGLNNCQGLVHAPGVRWRAQDVLRACKVSSWQFDNLIYGQSSFERYSVAQVPSGAIDLTDGIDEYKDKLRQRSPRFYKELGRKIRNLGRDFGELRFVADSRDVRELRMLMKWKSAQCQENNWVDTFSRPWVVDLVDHLFNTRSDLFSSWLSILYAGDTPVAGQFGLRSGGFFAGWFTAYDSAFRQYSPGLIQAIDSMGVLAASGVRSVDLGGTSDYQNKLKNCDIYFTRGMVTAGPVAAGAHQIRTASANWARQQIRRYPPLYHAADHMLRLSGRLA
jgi:CelD/BcsL family acetyltransferase involved in cellulose biosynthesis